MTKISVLLTPSESSHKGNLNMLTAHLTLQNFSFSFQKCLCHSPIRHFNRTLTWFWKGGTDVMLSFHMVKSNEFSWFSTSKMLFCCKGEMHSSVRQCFPNCGVGFKICLFWMILKGESMCANKNCNTERKEVYCYSVSMGLYES